MPQVGPGKSDGRDDSYWRETGLNAFVEDFGRGKVTFRAEDNYKFRTPSLRNVELTAPYGHSGAYESLRDVVLHHLDPVKAVEEYEADQSMFQSVSSVYELTLSGASLYHREMSNERREAFLRRDTWVQQNPELRQNLVEANELEAIGLNEDEVNDLLVFLSTLTDPSAYDLTELIPESVPSGLPVDR